MDIEKKDDIIVTVLTLTYNHEPYIRQCLDGIVMQQTNFKFELLIHDDASTDGTANIIREYESKYPDIIKPIYQKENQYSKKIPIGVTYLYPRAKGKYIALCEGDDYWTDPLKLQKQVDFLEANPDFVMCSHKFLNYYENNKSYGDFYIMNDDIVYDLDSFILRELWVTQPLTVMFRLSVLAIDEYSKYQNAKDLTLFYYLLKKGKGILLNEMMAIYRIHDAGIWQGATRFMRITADLKTVLGIYSIDKDESSSKLVKNSMIQFGYLGISFLRKNIRLYMKCIYAIYKHLGVLCTLNTINKTINYFNRKNT